MIPTDRRGFWYAGLLAIVVILIVILLTMQGAGTGGSVVTG